MLIHIPDVLTAEALAKCRAILEAAPWADGRITAGTQSARVKNNLQLPEDAPESAELRAIVLEHLNRSALFLSASLPRRIFPPLFNRYEGAANAFGNHIDNAVRTDLSATLFLSDPDDYDGGELVIEDTCGSHAVKLSAAACCLKWTWLYSNCARRRAIVRRRSI